MWRLKIELWASAFIQMCSVNQFTCHLGMLSNILWQILFLSRLWVSECDRAPLITCWCTGPRTQNLLFPSDDHRPWVKAEPGLCPSPILGGLWAWSWLGLPGGRLTLWCSLTRTKIFYFMAPLLNLYLRFHCMDEEYGDVKYHYFSLFFFVIFWHI